MGYGDSIHARRKTEEINTQREQRREAEVQRIIAGLEAGAGNLQQLAGPTAGYAALRARLEEKGVRIEQIEEDGRERLTIEKQGDGDGAQVRMVRPVEGIHIEYADMQYEQPEEEEFVAMHKSGNLVIADEDYMPQVNRTMEEWREVAPYIEKAIEEMPKYRERLDTLYQSGKLTAEQVLNRIRAIEQVYRELSGNPEQLEAFAGESAEVMRGKWNAYAAERKKLHGLGQKRGELEEITEKESIQGHCEELGSERRRLFQERQSAKEVRLQNYAEWKWNRYEAAWSEARAENGDFGERKELQEQRKPRPMYPGEVKPEQEERLREADRWLLETAMKRDKNMEDSTVFSLLNRSDVERIFAYYLIEKGCPAKITEGELLLFRRKEYRPNLEKLKKAKPGVSELERVYHLACEAGLAIDRLDEVQVASAYMQTALYGWEEQKKQEGQNAKNQEKTAAGQQEEQRAQALQSMLDRLEASLTALEEVQTRYEKANFFRKRRMKSELSGALEALYQSASDFLAAEIHVPGDESISNVADFIKGGLLSGTALKTAGSGLAAGFKQMAMSGELWAKAAAGTTAIAAHGLGIVLGGVNLLVAVMGILRTYKDFAGLTGAERLGLMMDWTSQLLSPTSTMASSAAGIGALTVANAAAQTAVTATAGIGAVAGGITMGVGAYKLGVSLAEGHKAKKAYRRLEEEKGQERYEENQREGYSLFYIPRGPDTQKEWRENFNFEKNIFKIQERINRRNKITAGCQAAGGACTLAASTLLVTQQHALAAIVGIAGIGAMAGGLIATQIMKRGEYEKAVDEYLNLDAMAEKWYAQIREKRTLGRLEKQKIRKRLRKEMMEQWGFSSAKSFYVYIMSEYAKFLYQKISPLFMEATGDVGVDSDTDIYKGLVESLGLKIETAKKTESEGGKNRPTVEMILKKLMG